MTKESIIVSVLALLSTGVAVIISRRMLCTLRRRDITHEGPTPEMMHIVDPHIKHIVDELYYRPGDCEANRSEKKRVTCQCKDCTGCAYSRLPALFHSGPHKECYQRYLMKHLPWNLLARAVRYATERSCATWRNIVQQHRKRKEVSHTTGKVPGTCLRPSQGIAE